MKKKILCLFLSITIILTSSSQLTSYANNSTQEDIIDNLISQLTTIRLNEISQNKHNYKYNTIFDNYNIYDKEQLIEDKLSSLGVHKNKVEDINIMINSLSKNKYPTIKSSNFDPYFPSNVDVYTFNGTLNAYKKFPKKVYWVVPKIGSNLIKFVNAFNVYDTPTKWDSFKKKIITIYANKLKGELIGKYKCIKWLPYELLDKEKDYTSVTQYDISVDLSSSMKYVYVYYDTSDMWNILLTTQQVSGREVHNFRTIENGKPAGDVKIRNYEINAPYFSSGDYEKLLIDNINDGNGFHILDTTDDLEYHDESDESDKLVKTIKPAYASFIIDLN